MPALKAAVRRLQREIGRPDGPRVAMAVPTQATTAEEWAARFAHLRRPPPKPEPARSGRGESRHATTPRIFTPLTLKNSLQK